jgi:hypothetical protein
VAAFWIIRLNGYMTGAAGLTVSYIMAGLAVTAWGVVNAEYQPKVAQSQDYTLMLALDGSATALAGGLATVGWGSWMLPADGLAGLETFWFQALFGCLLAGAVVISWVLARKPEPDTDTAEPLMLINTVLRPWRAAAYLINLAEPLPARPADERGV